MYGIVIIALVVIGLIASATYVLTFTPNAIKAYRHGTTRLKGWEIVDFAALPTACFLILMLSFINIVDLGVTPPSSPGTAIQRVATSALITGIVLLRLFRWHQTYRNTPEDERHDPSALFERHRKEAS